MNLVSVKSLATCTQSISTKQQADISMAQLPVSIASLSLHALMNMAEYSSHTATKMLWGYIGAVDYSGYDFIIVR